MSQGLFITFDGLDGTGKSTQANLLSEWLQGMGQRVTICRDPGTTPAGERIRKMLLEKRGPDGAENRIDARTETLLYMAARAQLVSEVISPALSSGETVISDRFVLANVVYQAHGLGIPPEEVWRLNEFPTHGLEPDATIVLDLDVQLAAARRGGEADRVEERDRAYRQRVRDGFLAEAAKRPDRIFVVSADADIETIHDQIKTTIGHLVK